MARPVQSDLRTRLQEWIPKIVLAPSVASMLIFVYGFIVFTGYLSFTNSRILPSFDLVGWHNYWRLFQLPTWTIAVRTLQSSPRSTSRSVSRSGLTLAIFLDQKIRGEGCCARSSSIRWRFRSS